MATSVVNALLSRLSSSSGKYSLTVDVGSAVVLSMATLKLSTSPLEAVAELLPLLAELLLALLPFHVALLSLLVRGSSAEQHWKMVVAVKRTITFIIFFIIIIVFVVFLIIMAQR